LAARAPRGAVPAWLQTVVLDLRPRFDDALARGNHPRVRVIRVLLAITVCAGVAVEVGASKRSALKACAPGYSPCLRVSPDLDCDQISEASKPVRVTGADRYGLDRDRDGLGCELAGQGGGARSPWGLILRKPPRKEATSAKPGDLLTVVGWSPASFKGTNYQLCQKRPTGLVCLPGPMPKQPLGFVLEGRVQTLGTWRVTRLTAVGGVLRVILRVHKKLRASDSVQIP